MRIGESFGDLLLLIGFLLALMLLASPALVVSSSGKPLVIEETETAVRPFLMDCARCSKITVRGTGNVSIDSEGNRTPIISERVRCRGCTIEFREDLACQPPVIPQPQP